MRILRSQVLKKLPITILCKVDIRPGLIVLLHPLGGNLRLLKDIHFGSMFMPFKEGKYTLTLDAKSYTLNYSNINAKYFFILAEPTIHTNDQNEITSVSVEYRDMNNALVNADNFVYQTQITLRGNQGIF